jgi:hypothetical protein
MPPGPFGPGREPYGGPPSSRIHGRTGGAGVRRSRSRGATVAAWPWGPPPTPPYSPVRVHAPTADEEMRSVVAAESAIDTCPAIRGGGPDEP